MPHSRFAVVALVVILAGYPGDAQAYLDPATGSMIIQIVVGGLAAAAFAIKTYWRQIKARFGGSPAAPSEPPSEPRAAEDRHGDD